MKKWLSFFLVVSLILLSVSSTMAESMKVKFTFSSDSISIGETVTVSYTVSGGTGTYDKVALHWEEYSGGTWIKHEYIYHYKTNTGTLSFAPQIGSKLQLCCLIYDSNGQTAVIDSDPIPVAGAKEYDPIKITISLDKKTVTAGGPVSATYSVTGGSEAYPKIALHWQEYKNGAWSYDYSYIYHYDTNTGSLTYYPTSCTQLRFGVLVYDSQNRTAVETSDIVTVNPYKCSQCGSSSVALDKYVDSTCTEDGHTEGSHCAGCGKIISPYTVILKKGHDEAVEKAVAPTCTEGGKTESRYCKRCGAILQEATSIAPLGHTVVIDKAVPATPTSTGLTEGSHCSVCNKVLKKQEIIDKIDINNTPIEIEREYKLVETVKAGKITAITVTMKDGTTAVISGDDAFSFSGTATITYDNGDTYSGDVVSRLKSGSGTYNWKDGGTYTGSFANDKIDGKGTFQYSVGNKAYSLTGTFQDGKPAGVFDFTVYNSTTGGTTQYSLFFENGSVEQQASGNAVENGWGSDGNGRYYGIHHGKHIGWLYVDNMTCYFDSTGHMVTGLQNIDGNQYYFNPETGALQGGLQFADGTYRYFDPQTGAMVQDCVIGIDSQYFYFDQNGAISFSGTDESRIPKIPGDINGDQDVNELDLLRIMKYLAGEEVEIDFSQADVNGDGEIDGQDVIRLMKYLAGEDEAILE